VSPVESLRVEVSESVGWYSERGQNYGVPLFGGFGSKTGREVLKSWEIVGDLGGNN